MTRNTKQWKRRAVRIAGKVVVDTAKVADNAGVALFRWVTTDHLGVAKNLPKGLSPWQEIKMVFKRMVIGIISLILVWGAVIAVILLLAYL